MKPVVTPETLQTSRLTLRAPRLEDFEHIAAYYASDRSVYEDGPLPRAQVWSLWAGDVANWMLRGYGPFSLEADGVYVGEVGFYHRDNYPQIELGWLMTPEAEGKGYAFEAAQAVMAWGQKALGLTRFVNYIDPANTRSIALAKRLGGVQVDEPGTDPSDVVMAIEVAQ